LPSARSALVRKFFIARSTKSVPPFAGKPVASRSLTWSSGARRRVAVIKTETIIMDITTQIFELRAELYGCLLTKAERAKAKAELAALIAQEQAEAEKFAKEIEAFPGDLE
jgi:hypothetical protein